MLNKILLYLFPVALILCSYLLYLQGFNIASCILLIPAFVILLAIYLVREENKNEFYD